MKGSKAMYNVICEVYGPSTSTVNPLSNNDSKKKKKIFEIPIIFCLVCVNILTSFQLGTQGLTKSLSGLYMKNLLKNFSRNLRHLRRLKVLSERLMVESHVECMGCKPRFLSTEDKIIRIGFIHCF